jgi:hypothetical protein
MVWEVDFFMHSVRILTAMTYKGMPFSFIKAWKSFSTVAFSIGGNSANHGTLFCTRCKSGFIQVEDDHFGYF